MKLIFYQSIRFCFSCTKLQYLKCSTKELQRWPGTARKILQRYKRSLNYIERNKATSTYYTIYDPNNNIYLQPTAPIHIIYKASRTHHLKASPIKKYYHSSKTNITNTLSNSPVPTAPNTNLATSTINKNVFAATIIPINTVVDQDQSNQHNNDQERNQKNLT